MKGSSVHLYIDFWFTDLKCIAHTYNVGDQVMVKEDPQCKLSGGRFSGPYMVTQVNDNGTVLYSSLRPPMELSSRCGTSAM
jgi:hypothetical protein